MQLTFKKITMNNFLSFEHAELDLSNMGYAIVTGHNYKTTDNSQSNGSGKSTIFNAICYALTGETSQGLKNNVENIYANPDDCWVELEFNVDNDNFIVKRIKTPRSDMKITVNGVDASGKGITESTNLLAQYIPDLSSELIGSTIILGQGMPCKFASNTPSRRKSLLESLTKSDYLIQSVRDKLDKRQAELNAQLRSHEDSLVVNNTQTDMYIKQVEELNKELAKYNSSIDFEKRLVELDKLIKKDDDKLADTATKTDTTNLKIDDLTKQMLELTTKRNATQDLDEVKEIATKIDSSLKSKTDLMVKKSTLEGEIKRLEAIIDICPTCGQKIPGAHKVDTTKQKEELETYNKSLKDIDEEISKLNETKLGVISKYEAKIDKQLEKVNEDIKKCRELLQKSIELTTSTLEHKQQCIAEQVDIKNLKENYDRVVINLEASEKTLVELKENKKLLENEIFNDNEHLGVVQNLISLTKREYRNVLLGNVVNYMNTKAKQYAQKVFNNDLLSITTNENNIDIMFDGRYYESMSGGEKQKVDIIIQLALRSLLGAHVGLHSNILALDEIFDNLDQTGCQNILDLISNLNDIESIFIISHHANELQISYDTEIEVNKDDNGISTLNIK